MVTGRCYCLVSGTTATRWRPSSWSSENTWTVLMLLPLLLPLLLLSRFSRVSSCLFVSDSVRPHRRQSTRLPRPWDSPGKNTGVGCHFLLQCMKVKSQSEVAQSCPTLSDPLDCSLPGSSVHGIFQARVLEWGAIAFSVWYSCSCPIFINQCLLTLVWLS